MKITDILGLTFNSLRSNLLRSGLSSLGVFMGVFAISGTLQASDIGKSYLQKELEQMEAPQIFIYPPYTPNNYQQSQYQIADLDWLKANLSGWRYLSPVNSGDSGTIYYQNQKINVESQAVTADFLAISGRKLILGQFLNQDDFKRVRPVIVIDQIIAQKIFKSKNPLGKNLNFNGKTYYIKGVVETKQNYYWGEPQGLILMPLSVYQALKSSKAIDTIVISPNNSQELEKIQNQALQLLRKRFPKQEVYGYSNIEGIKSFGDLLNIVAIILLVIGGIALLVGGVGIANITIASVAERTSEIGLRRAIGATKKQIMIQFILEAIFISMVGGFLAIITIQGVTVITVSIFNLPYQFNYKTPLASLGSAIIVGLGSSFIPAWRASQLDPVQALRSQ